jgi:hypothetical protein
VDREASLGVRILEVLAQAEIDEIDRRPGILVNQDVVWLEVTVHDAEGMQVF